MDDLDESFYERLVIEGREFQKRAIDRGIYFAPIDDEEIERLDQQHQMLAIVFDDRLIFPPISHPQKVLDCGYGSGAWAVEVAEKHEHCAVVGVDSWPHVPDYPPENLSLQVDDLNRRFIFGRCVFDLIQSRLVACGINESRWPEYVEDIFRSLKPGGWTQMVEIYWNIQSDNGSLTDDHALRKWSQGFAGALEGHKDTRVGMKLGALMASAGLVEVESKMIPLPLCGWPIDPRMKAIGEANKDNVQKWLGTLSLYPFLRILQFTRAGLDELIAQAKEEALDPSLKAYLPLYVWIGQKPSE